MLREIASVLTPGLRRAGIGSVALMAVTAVVEAASIASVMPFLATITYPDVVRTNPLLASLYAAGAFSSERTFAVALGGVSLVLIVLAAICRSVNTYAQQAFANRCRVHLESGLLDGYLRQSYEFFVMRNVDSLSKNVLSEVDQFVDRAVSPILQVVSSAFLLLFIVVMLVAVDRVSAIVTAVFVSALYVAVYMAVRTTAQRIGSRRAAANSQRFQAAGEALSGIKAIRVAGAEATYSRVFRAASQINARSQALNAVLGQTPRNFIEGIALGGVIVLALVLLSTTGSEGIGETLAMLGLYAFAGYRVLPAAQNIYQNLTTIRFAVPNVALVAKEMALLGRAPAADDDRQGRLALESCLELDDVSYGYPGSGGHTLEHVSLTVPRGTILGIVGPSGAGKSTLVDIVLGLLAPSSGAVKVDGQPIGADNVRRWRRNVGYVPQDIFLSDATVVRNIAFGCPEAGIDMDKVRACAARAQIAEFIETLPAGYDTEVGQRGVRLSGGQRQRIGIARALYTDPEVIVFDEATSALDNLTESEVMASLAAFAGSKTLILVAHRISTLQACDRIAVLLAGRLSTTCSYEEFVSEQRALLVSAP